MADSKSLTKCSYCLQIYCQNCSDANKWQECCSIECEKEKCAEDELLNKK